MEEDTFDYDGLLQANLRRIFGEGDAVRRNTAISEIYLPEAVLYEPGHIATGHTEIARTIDALLRSFPSNFVFTADGPGIGHHGMARLRWRAGPADAPPTVSGTDVIQVEQGRIKTIHVFLDPTTS